jgi:hypothetical protein
MQVARFFVDQNLFFFLCFFAKALDFFCLNTVYYRYRETKHQVFLNRWGCLIRTLGMREEQVFDIERKERENGRYFFQKGSFIRKADR